MIDIGARLSELEALGLSRKTRLVSGPQGPRVVLNGKPTLSLCSANYLGLADHPSVREAAAEAALRWGAGTGASRLTSGTMTIHRRLEERLAASSAARARSSSARASSPAPASIAALARPGDVVFADELSHPSITRRLPASRRRDVPLRPPRCRPPGLGDRQVRRPRRPDRHREHLRRPAATSLRSPTSSSWPSAAASASSSTSRTASAPPARVAAERSPSRAPGPGRRGPRLARHVARVLRRLRRLRPGRWPPTCSTPPGP